MNIHKIASRIALMLNQPKRHTIDKIEIARPINLQHPEFDVSGTFRTKPYKYRIPLWSPDRDTPLPKFISGFDFLMKWDDDYDDEGDEDISNIMQNWDTEIEKYWDKKSHEILKRIYGP